MTMTGSVTVPLIRSAVYGGLYKPVPVGRALIAGAPVDGLVVKSLQANVLTAFLEHHMAGNGLC